MTRYNLILYGQHLNQKLLSIDELGKIVGTHPGIIKRYIDFGLIDPHIDTPEPLFDDSIIARIRKIERLKNDLGINLAGCGLVLDLLERISELETQLYTTDR
jgi:DNA-binding transcriptional MerR regulator